MLFYLLKYQEERGAVEGEKVNVPGDRRKVINPGEGGVEEESAEEQLEEDAEINQGVGEQVQDDGVPVEKM